VAELQEFTTLDEVCVLAHEVEQQKKKQLVRRDFPKP